MEVRAKIRGKWFPKCTLVRILSNTNEATVQKPGGAFWTVPIQDTNLKVEMRTSTR